MTNKKRTYNTGKTVTRKELDNLIQDAKANGDWSKVEQADVSDVTDMSHLFKDAKGVESLNLRVDRACHERATTGFYTRYIKSCNLPFLIPFMIIYYILKHLV